MAKPADVYQDRITALTERRGDVVAQRDARTAERAARIREGRDTGDLWTLIQGDEQELHMLDRELAELQNLASVRFASERLRTDRAEFAAANRSLSGKRGMLPRMRDEAIAAVIAAADRLQQYVRELDEMERQQAARADELNRTAAVLGEPADFALPDTRQPNMNQPYTRPDAKTFATTRLMNAARRHDRKEYMVALAEAAEVYGRGQE